MLQVNLLHLPKAKQFLYAEDLVVFNSKPNGMPDFESWFEVGSDHPEQSEKWLNSLCTEEKLIVVVAMHIELQRLKKQNSIMEGINLN